jgi:hypothetical protein
MMQDDLDEAVMQGMDIQEENINGFKVISGVYTPKVKNNG